MRAELVSLTQPSQKLISLGITTPEQLIVYCARVSNPNNQLNTETAPKLIAFLLKNKHFSPFEMVDMCVEIETSRAIAAQILRHWSFSFQEFSLRYSKSDCEFEPQQIRFKGSSNRQGSVPPMTYEEIKHAQKLETTIIDTQNYCAAQYSHLLSEGVAPEVARMVLPLGLTTRLYMKGSIRDWIFYLQTRTDSHAQQEHQGLAYNIKTIFNQNFPDISSALENSHS